MRRLREHLHPVARGVDRQQTEAYQPAKPVHPPDPGRARAGSPEPRATLRPPRASDPSPAGTIRG
jgi:hypothetical protein